MKGLTMTRYFYLYDSATSAMKRWNARTEKSTVIKGNFGDAIVARSAAQEDFNRLKKTRVDVEALFDDGCDTPNVYLD